MGLGLVLAKRDIKGALKNSFKTGKKKGDEFVREKRLKKREERILIQIVSLFGGKKQRKEKGERMGVMEKRRGVGLIWDLRRYIREGYGRDEQLR